MGKLVLWIALAFVPVCFGQLPQSQTTPVAPPTGATLTRTIEGTVLDPNGAPVPHAIVVLKDTATLQLRSYIAQSDGRYHFFGLNSDVNYELRAQANGLSSPQKTVSVFASRRVIKLDLKLKKPKTKKDKK
jgi:hypothetical protein